ncbi:MAG: hypothetical protein J6X93_01940 [Bacilli bacterium]|nr:hypothetical protein [Bacilli bacterium]
MAKKSQKDNKKFIKTKKKLDDSVEIEIQKNPSKTLGGKIFIALIVAGTILLPLAVVIAYIIIAFR